MMPLLLRSMLAVPRDPEPSYSWTHLTRTTSLCSYGVLNCPATYAVI